MGGRLVFPGGGAYHASKYALEAFSDALRFETRGFGIAVVLVEPGLIKSDFSETAVASIEASGTGEYADFHAAVATSTKEAYEKGPLARFAGRPEDVAAVIAKAIRATKPKARYTVTGSAKILLAQRAVLSDRAWDCFLRTQFPTPGMP